MSRKRLCVHAVGPGSSPELRRRVFRLRYRVYVEEMGLDVGGDPETGLRDQTDDAAVSFLCARGDEDLGTLRFVGIRDCPLELFEQSRRWVRTVDANCYSGSSYGEVNRFMVVRAARNSDVAMRLVNAAFAHMTRLGYDECYIAAKKGRLLEYYKRFYRGTQLTSETAPYSLNGRVLGQYHLMRFDHGRRWSLRRLQLTVYYAALALCVQHLRPLVRLAIGRRSGFGVKALPVTEATSPPRLVEP